MRVHFVVHESFEAPGAYETWVRRHGFDATYSRVYELEPLPQSVADIDLLVILGGPQSPSTTPSECPHFDASAEKALISQCVEAQKMVVGVCLGAQLIGEALGAECEHSPEKEIGKFPIFLTEDGARNEKFSGFGGTIEVGHWHSDMPGLTPDAKVIAYSDGCPRQIIEYTELVYGFQCHMEFTEEVIERLIEAETELPNLALHRFVQQSDVLRQHDFCDMNLKLFGFLDKLVQDYRQQKKN